MGTSYGTGEIAFVYKISIQKWVSFPYTCQPRNAQIYQKIAEKRNDKIDTSIYFPLFRE
jgi:hypothetical protein